MYRNRNLDIFIAGGIALLGGAGYVAHVPGPVQVVLGIALFFTPGYLWSEAILSQRLSGTERVLTTAALALIFPILGGFLFFALRIPLLSSAWVGLLVVLTLLGVVAVAVVRLREQAAGQAAGQPRPEPGRRTSAAQKLTAPHVLTFGLAAVIALGSIGYSVHSANTQKYPGYTQLWMTPEKNQPAKASLGVLNGQGAAEQYELKLLQKGKVTTTWKFTLANGQTWSRVIAYTTASAMEADLYLLPDVTAKYRYVTNGE